MALKQRDESKKYLRIRNGKLYVGKDTETPFDEIEGQITSLYYKDEEYEGTPQRKLIIILSDGDETYQLSLNTESNNYSALVSFLPNVDITKTLTLHPKSDVSNRDGKEVTRNSILVSQNGKFAKSYFTKENTHGLPSWEIATVGKKKVTDKTAYLEFLEDFVTNKLANKLKNTVVKQAVDVDEEEPVEAEKLPWE